MSIANQCLRLLAFSAVGSGASSVETASLLQLQDRAQLQGLGKEHIVQTEQVLATKKQKRGSHRDGKGYSFAPYKSNRCAEARTIHDATACEWAAASSKSWEWKRIGSWADRPSGCYIKNDKVYFNTHVTGGTGKYRRRLCRDVSKPLNVEWNDMDTMVARDSGHRQLCVAAPDAEEGKDYILFGSLLPGGKCNPPTDGPREYVKMQFHDAYFGKGDLDAETNPNKYTPLDPIYSNTPEDQTLSKGLKAERFNYGSWADGRAAGQAFLGFSAAVASTWTGSDVNSSFSHARVNVEDTVYEVCVGTVDDKGVCKADAVIGNGEFVFSLFGYFDEVAGYDDDNMLSDHVMLRAVIDIGEMGNAKLETEPSPSGTGIDTLHIQADHSKISMTMPEHFNWGQVNHDRSIGQPVSTTMSAKILSVPGAPNTVILSFQFPKPSDHAVANHYFVSSLIHVTTA